MITVGRHIATRQNAPEGCMLRVKVAMCLEESGDALVALAGKVLHETTLQRQQRRYAICCELATRTWQKMPDDDGAPLPRGIKQLAAAEGISVSAFSKDVKKHIARQVQAAKIVSTC